MTSLSTHVLDLERGRPGAGIGVVLEQRRGEVWTQINRASTNLDGRVEDLGTDLAEGTYRLVFATGATNSFFPEIQVVIAVTADQGHLHVPVLLSPFGYTTYRGS